MRIATNMDGVELPMLYPGITANTSPTTTSRWNNSRCSGSTERIGYRSDPWLGNERA